MRIVICAIALICGLTVVTPAQVDADTEKQLLVILDQMYAAEKSMISTSFVLILLTTLQKWQATDACTTLRTLRPVLPTWSCGITSCQIA